MLHPEAATPIPSGHLPPQRPRSEGSWMLRGSHTPFQTSVPAGTPGGGMSKSAISPGKEYRLKRDEPVLSGHVHPTPRRRRHYRPISRGFLSSGPLPLVEPTAAKVSSNARVKPRCSYPDVPDSQSRFRKRSEEVPSPTGSYCYDGIIFQGGRRSQCSCSARWPVHVRLLRLSLLSLGAMLTRLDIYEVDRWDLPGIYPKPR